MRAQTGNFGSERFNCGEEMVQRVLADKHMYFFVHIE